jgi:hypothetical protein
VSWQNWIVAIMLAMSFIDRMMNVVDSHRRAEWQAVASLSALMLWFGGIVMLLHSGGFW